MEHIFEVQCSVQEWRASDCDSNILEAPAVCCVLCAVCMLLFQKCAWMGYAAGSGVATALKP